MSVTEQTVRRVVWRRTSADAGERVTAPAGEAIARPQLDARESFEIAQTDPLVGSFQDAVGAVEIAQLDLDSPALAELREAGVTLVVPLITNGELIGLLSVGRRLSRSEENTSELP